MSGPTRNDVALAQAMQEAFDKIAERMDRMERGMSNTADSAQRIADYSRKSLDQIDQTIIAEQNRAAVMQSIAETEVSNYQRRADAFLGAQPREHALVVHELPDGAVAARLERDRHILLLGDHPRAAAHGHHGHERLLEEPEPALAAAEKRLLFHERGDARRDIEASDAREASERD